MLNNNEGMKNGYAVLPIETYNKMTDSIAELIAELDGIITLEERYDGQITVRYNKDDLYKLAVKKFYLQGFDRGDRVLKTREEFYIFEEQLTKPVEKDEEPAAEGEES